MGAMKAIVTQKMFDLDKALRDAVCAGICKDRNAEKLANRYNRMRAQFTEETNLDLIIVDGYHEIA